MEGSGASWSCQTQSALREGLLDLIQHIPKQCWLVTFSVNAHGLTRLRKIKGVNSLFYIFNWYKYFKEQKTRKLTYSFDQQTDMVTLDRPAVHGGTGVDPLYN